MANVTIKSYRKEREAEILNNLQKGLEKAGAIVERQARINILTHEQTTPWERTSQVASAVTHQLTDNNMAVEIGIKQGEHSKGTSLAKIGKYLEFGHIQHPGQFVKAIGKRLVKSHVPAYPWLFPALEVKKNEIKEALKGKFTIG